MGNVLNTKNSPGQPAVYQITLEGHLSPEWEDWFGGLAITLQESGNTLLTGSVVDQAALHGLLRKVRDLGMSLLAVNRVGTGVNLPTANATPAKAGAASRLFPVEDTPEV